MPLNLTPFEPPIGNMLDNRQRAEMALVIHAWSMVEVAIEKLICRLAQAPEALGQAITEDLGPDHRLKALRRLCRAWEIQLGPNHEMAAMLGEVKTLVKWVQQNKDSRNKLVHWTWQAIDADNVYCFKYSLKPPGDEPLNSFQWVSVDGLTRFFIEVSQKSTDLRAALEKLGELPSWPEIPLVLAERR